MAKTKYGMTWWGEQWLCALKGIDYANRIPRGASYARKGMVKSIDIVDNVVRCKVAGSRRLPYKVDFVVRKFTAEQIDKLINLIVENPSILSKLFNRQLDENLAAIAERAGISLFPRQWRDLYMSCSCPDIAVPCKHLAAVIYTISMEIDSNPFLVFSLHGVDLLDELQKRGIVANAGEVMEIANLDTIINTDNTKIDESKELSLLDYTILPNLVDSLPRLLKKSPSFYHFGDFRAEYEKMLGYVAKQAEAILCGKRDIVDVCADKGSVIEEFGVQDISSICKLQELYNIPLEDIGNYKTIAEVTRQMLCFSLQLISHGCILPQIYKSITTYKRGKVNRKTETYCIKWRPALNDKNTALLFSKLNQSLGTICLLITNLVNHLSKGKANDSFSNMFFEGEAQVFDKIGEQSIPGGISSWLSCYYLQSKYTISLVIDEVSEGFVVNVQIDNKPLKVIMRDMYMAVKTDIIGQLGPLCDMVSGLSGYIDCEGEKPMRYDMGSFSEFLFEVIPAIQLLGVKIIMPKSLMAIIRPKATVRIKSAPQDNLNSFISLEELLSFDWQVALGDEILSVEEFNKLADRAKGLLRFKESYIYLDEEDLQKLYKSMQRTTRLKAGELLQIALSGEFEGAGIALTREAKKLIEKFRDVAPIDVPLSLKAKLRPYQERGYSWMYRNMQIGFGSVIADDMGLGKTLQIIALLLKMQEEGQFIKRRALVVVPTGLLFNWQTEIERFAPSLKVFIYHGATRDLQVANKSDIILTTYGVVRSDVEQLKRLKLQVLVIDEAQNIKNHTAAQSKAVRYLSAKNYIAMSGTPVENRLLEFWSIIDFTNKGYLGTANDFKRKYAIPIQKDGDSLIVERFRRVTAPFIMRRLKTDKSIISDLPDKIERNEYAFMTSNQTALYNETLNYCMNLVMGVTETDSKSLFKRQGLILQMMLALKQICNHPNQYIKDSERDPSLSGKALMLLDFVKSIVDAKEKVLIFTQFKEMGDLLVEFIQKELSIEAMFYHGGCTIKQRKEMVDSFQNDRNKRVFILSLKAAGTGLNLTAATHVIHYDLWWNPAVEAQATDRAYRIGQHSNVQVHRFITKGTFEEKIDAMIQKKKALADLTVSSGENWIGKLSNEELKEIFAQVL